MAANVVKYDGNINQGLRDVIVDIGNGQLAVLTTSTAPAFSSFSVGVAEDTFVNDLVTNTSQTIYQRFPTVSENVVTYTESITVAISSPTEQPSGVFDAVTSTEAVTMGDIPNAIVNDAATTAESVTIGYVGTPSLNDATTTSENVSVALV